MTAVFLDTVGLLALWDASDQWHSAAEVAFEKLASKKIPLITTTFILLECGNAAARRPYRATVDRLRKQLANTEALITPTAEDWETAWANYSKGETGHAGIVDHISFAVMKRLCLREAFTNDQHFVTAGFIRLF